MHVEYAKQYIDQLKENNPIEYEKWRKFAWDYDFTGTAPQVDFLIRVLGWIKVGVYSMPKKILTFAYLSEDEGFRTITKRMKTIDSYVKQGYQKDSLYGIVDLEELEEPPEAYQP